MASIMFFQTMLLYGMHMSLILIISMFTHGLEFDNTNLPRIQTKPTYAKKNRKGMMLGLAFIIIMAVLQCGYQLGKSDAHLTGVSNRSIYKRRSRACRHVCWNSSRTYHRSGNCDNWRCIRDAFDY